jgi:hypothetical protein
VKSKDPQHRHLPRQFGRRMQKLFAGLRHFSTTPIQMTPRLRLEDVHVARYSIFSSTGVLFKSRLSIPKCLSGVMKDKDEKQGQYIHHTRSFLYCWEPQLHIAKKGWMAGMLVRKRKPIGTRLEGCVTFVLVVCMVTVPSLRSLQPRLISSSTIPEHQTPLDKPIQHK